MSERTDSSVSPDGKRSGERPNDVHPSRQALLEESRTTAEQQLAQIDKIDESAVRTVRMAFVLLGIIAGSSRLLSSLDFGRVGTLGTLALIGALLAGLFVYGTSRLFLGISTDELDVDYEGNPPVEQTHVELIGKYEDGIRFNRNVLHTNGFVLLVARGLLALAVVLLVFGVVHYVVLFGDVVSTVQTFIR